MVSYSVFVVGFFVGEDRTTMTMVGGRTLSVYASLDGHPYERKVGGRDLKNILVSTTDDHEATR